MEWLTGRDLYRAVVTEGVLRARESVWIATANLKDLHVPTARPRRRYRPILEEFSRMAAFVAMLQREFDTFWMGVHCDSCGLRDLCPDPIR